MNIAELKLDIFRRIDRLKEEELRSLYKKLLGLTEPTAYQLTDSENKAINEALESSSPKNYKSTEEIKTEAKLKYPKLKFE